MVPPNPGPQSRPPAVMPGSSCSLTNIQLVTKSTCFWLSLFSKPLVYISLIITCLMLTVPPKIPLENTSMNLSPLEDKIQGFFFFFFGQHHVACRILIPQPGIEPGVTMMKVPSLNHRTARDVPKFKFLMWLSKPSTIQSLPMALASFLTLHHHHPLQNPKLYISATVVFKVHQHIRSLEVSKICTLLPFPRLSLVHLTYLSNHSLRLPY